MRLFSFPEGRQPGRSIELLSVELLEEHARRLAALLSTKPRGGRGGAHLRQLSADMRAMRQVYTSLAADARLEAMTPAADRMMSR